MYIVITSKTTGLNFYLLQNLLITMLQALLLVFFHFLLIRGIIQILLFTLNAILLPSKLTTLLQISMSYRVPSKLKSLQPNNIIRNLLMHNISPLLILKQITNSLSKLSSSELPSLQKSFLKNILNFMKPFLSLVHYYSLSIFQILCTLSIQFSMCLCSNLPHPTFSPREHNQPSYQL